MKNKLSQLQRTAKHKAENPRDEMVRKERQRRKDAMLRFHIRRKKIGKIDLPSSIHLCTKAAAKALTAYGRECSEPVEIEETA